MEYRLKAFRIEMTWVRCNISGRRDERGQKAESDSDGFEEHGEAIR